MDMDDYDKECFDRIQRIAELEEENKRLRQAHEDNKREFDWFKTKGSTSWKTVASYMALRSDAACRVHARSKYHK